MKFYVAGKFQDYLRVRMMIDYLTAHGDTVSYDWTRTDEFGEDGIHKFKDHKELDEDKLKRYAASDLAGVESADYIVVLGDGDLMGAKFFGVHQIR